MECSEIFYQCYHLYNIIPSIRKRIKTNPKIVVVVVAVEAVDVADQLVAAETK